MIIPSDPGLIADFGVFQKSWGKSTIFTNTAKKFDSKSHHILTAYLYILFAQREKRLLGIMQPNHLVDA
jgi:hypothetical protein